MTLNQVIKICNDLSLKKNDEFSIPIVVNKRMKKCLGKVVIGFLYGAAVPSRLEISEQFLQTATEESVEAVIKHEWCHYYITKTTCQHHGHDSVFKQLCAEIGCTNDGTQTKVERIVEDKEVYKYTVYCGKCGKVIRHYHRMCPTLKNITEYKHTECGTYDLYYKTNF